jgi:hypothetical protein
MAAKTTTRVPKYRLHKTWGLGVVRINGKAIYLGKHGTPESEAEYRRVISEWLASGGMDGPTQQAEGSVPAGCSVKELVLGYLAFAKTYYVKNGRPTGELPNIKGCREAVGAGVRPYLGHSVRASGAQGGAAGDDRC